MPIEISALADQGLLRPDWGGCPPPGVQALVTTRISLQGYSQAPYGRFNVATHVGDDPLNVAANRQQLRRLLPDEPYWLDQVHGTRVVCADRFAMARLPEAREAAPVAADASYARTSGSVCCVMTADCLPLLLAAQDGSVVAAIHAGWRGLAAGIIEATVAALAVPGRDLHVWLGPAIGSRAFIVGDEVRQMFCQQAAQAAQAFVAHETDGSRRWQADLYLLARLRLLALGVKRISGGEYCTYTDTAHFYSYRRDGVSGRMASLIWRTS